MLAEEKVKSQSEREMRSKLEAQHAAKVAELERQLKEAPAAAAERVAELEKAAHLAINMEATAESKRKAAEATLANVREQLIDQKERTKRAEEAAQLANEAQRAQAAEVDEAEAGESRLKARLDEALKECGTLQADAAAASQLRMKLKEAEGQRDMAREEVGQLQSQNKERILAYEGAVADGRKHKTAAEKATEQCKKEAQRADAEQKRADSLAAERAQLEQSLAHAEKIRALFQSVTSRTNQVQEAANEVIATVEKRKKAEKATQQQQQQQRSSSSRRRRHRTHRRRRRRPSPWRRSRRFSSWIRRPRRSRHRPKLRRTRCSRLQNRRVRRSARAATVCRVHVRVGLLRRRARVGRCR